MLRLRKLLLVIAATGLIAACQKRIDFSLYPSSEELYKAALEALNDGRPRSAALAFERLTLQLGQRDTLLPRSYWYLGVSQMRDKEWQLAGNAFRRIHTIFSTDSLADDGLLAAARMSRRLWPNPELDSSYGEDAKDLLGTLLQTYPATNLREEVFAELNALDEMFAAKDYEVANDYFRDKLFHPAIEYANDVVEGYPATRKAKDARMLIVKAYRRLTWATEAEAQCKLMRDLYRNDADIGALCGTSPRVAAVPP